jgi:archaellum biogenesis protein FlaJ (TadC family)
MNILTNYVRFIIVIKIIFLYFSITAFLAEAKLKKNPANKQLEKEYEEKIYLKDRVELLFKFCMSILLVYVFYPQRKVPIPIDYEMRVLLCAFGFVLILTAQWKTILTDNTLKKYAETANKIAK